MSSNTPNAERSARFTADTARRRWLEQRAIRNGVERQLKNEIVDFFEACDDPLFAEIENEVFNKIEAQLSDPVPGSSAEIRFVYDWKQNETHIDKKYNSNSTVRVMIGSNTGNITLIPYVKLAFEDYDSNCEKDPGYYIIWKFGSIFEQVFRDLGFTCYYTQRSEVVTVTIKWLPRIDSDEYDDFELASNLFTTTAEVDAYFKGVPLDDIIA